MKRIIFIVLAFIHIVNAQITDKSYFDFLNLEKVQYNTEYESFISEEMEKYVFMYPESSNTAEVLRLIADLKYKNRYYHEAFANYLKIHVLFSNLIIDDSKNKLNAIITDDESSDYEAKLNDLQSILTQKYDGSLMDNLYQYIKILFETNVEELYPYVLKETRFYLNNFPESINNDNILLIIAKTHELQGNHEQAMFYYEMMVSTFPQSPQLSFAKYQIGSLMLNEFKEYDKAIIVFKDVVTSDPNYKFAHEAQFSVANIYQENLDQSEPAINNYNLYLENYPTEARAVSALFKIAEIQNDEDLYESEVSTYKRVIENYLSHERAVEAQEKIIDRYKNSLNNLNKAAEEYIEFAKLFPDHEDAAEMIYDGIEIYIEELKLVAEAKAALKILEEKYPESKYTENSKELIAEFIKDNPEFAEPTEAQVDSVDN